MLSSSAGMYGGLEISHVASVAAAPLKKQLLCTCARPKRQHAAVTCETYNLTVNTDVASRHDKHALQLPPYPMYIVYTHCSNARP